MRIVLSTFGTLGDVHPMIALALELRSRGHRPVLAVPEIFRRKVSPLGLDFAPVGPNLDPENSSLVAELMDVNKGTERTLREILFPAVRRSYEELLEVVTADGGADLLLAGELVYQAPIVAEVTGVPWASYVLAPLSFFSGYDAPALPPYPRLAKLQDAVPGVGQLSARFARWVTRNWSEPVYQLRSELKLDKGKDPIFEAKHSPALVLALFSPLLGQPQPDWPKAVKVTGFVYYDGDAGKRELPTAVDRFLQNGPPPIVFTLGSVAVLDAGSFFEMSAQAARRTGQRAVMIVGTDTRNFPSELSSDLCLAEYAPFSKLFPRSSLIVHQGGVGTTAHAMRAGKPMLVMPYSHDQPDNARRVRRLGIARVVRRQDYTADRAVEEIRWLMQNAEVNRRASAIGEQLNRENGLKTACDALEGMVKT
jgi:UDP:flavonoid glycosyltransferase YjiC (YdhE family)